MEKNLKCISCGYLIAIAITGNVYYFTDKYCKDCREKLEKQPHNIEVNLSSNTRQSYISGLSSTAYVVDTSINWPDSKHS